MSARPARRRLLALPLLAALTPPCPAGTAGIRPVMEALSPLLPAGEKAPERRFARVGVSLAFGAPMRAARMALRANRQPRERLRDLAAALARDGAKATTGAVHRQLELRHLDLGDTRVILERLAARLEHAARVIEGGVGEGRLSTALALAEVARVGRGNLEDFARALRKGAESHRLARSRVARMLAFVENIQDATALPERSRIRFEARPGSHQRLHRSLVRLEAGLGASEDALDRLRSLLRVRWLGMLEAIKNLARDAKGPRPGIRGLAPWLARLSDARATAKREMLSLGMDLDALEKGERRVPELPPLPEWLFTPAPPEPGRTRPPARYAAGRAGRTAPDPHALSLLDELEAEIDAPTRIYDDPLTTSLAESFRQRHGLPASETQADIIASDPADLDRLESLLDDLEEDPGENGNLLATGT